MKKILLLLSIFLSLATIAQDFTTNIDTLSTLVDSANVDTCKVVLITDEMPNAIVHQDSALVQLMRDKRLGHVRGEQIIDGFRVQIYASNNQQVAKNAALLLQQQMQPLIDVPVYALSEPPFWKVRLGNFMTREEANAYKETLLNSFPEMVGSTYVVPDKIILIQ